MKSGSDRSTQKSEKGALHVKKNFGFAILTILLFLIGYLAGMSQNAEIRYVERKNFGIETFAGQQVLADGRVLGTVGNPNKKGYWEFALRNTNGKVELLGTYPLIADLVSGASDAVMTYRGSSSFGGTPYWQPTLDHRYKYDSNLTRQASKK